jgi:CBS domain-containing protein
MNVSELMTSHPAFVSPEQKLAVAAQLMWDRDCGALPVVHQDGHVVGMLTDRDICMASWSRGLALDAISVADAMSTQLAFCGPDDAISTAETSMRKSQVRRLPVLDPERRLLGILSLADIARATASTSVRTKQLSTDGVAATLAVICDTAAGPASGRQHAPA